MAISEQQAILTMQSNPLSFAKTYSLTPYSAGNSGQKTVYMVDATNQTKVQPTRPGTILGLYNVHKTQRFSIRPNNTFGGTAFQVENLAVDQSNTNWNVYVPAITGASILITTQLTGCCFVFDPNTGGVAHVQPNGVTGSALRNTLKQAGYVVWGQPDYFPGRGVVFGALSNNTWHFYGQKQDANYNVLGATKII